MRISHILTATILLAAMLMAGACDSGPGPDGGDGINSDIVQVKDCCGDLDKIAETYFMAAWRNDGIFSTSPIRKLTMGPNFKVRNIKETYWNEIRDELSDYFGFGSYLGVNQAGTKLLIVKTKNGAVSMGALYEYKLASSELRLLRDSTYNISSAVHWPGSSGTKLVYYSYGQPIGEGAGYYLLNTQTGADSLLLEHFSPTGPDEMLNGFDLSPDGRTLLVPNVRATSSQARPPQIVAYDLQAQTADTLAVDFTGERGRIGLWLRYSPDGSQILYSNFPEGVYTSRVSGPSEVGLIEMPEEEKQVLDVNTNPDGSSVQLAPTWSPDGQHILYGSAPGPAEEPPGAKGDFSLYVLKNVN